MLNSVSVLAWNVGHKVYKSRKIPASLGAALEQICADVIFLSEYVDQNDLEKARFYERLDASGYIYRALAPAPGAYGSHNLYNRIFAASRLPFAVGDLTPPVTDEFATSNFLHLRLDDSDIELVGIRAPAYKGSIRTSYRKEVTELLRSADTQDRALAVVGDWNRYPLDLVAGKFSAPQPNVGWSYVHSRGEKKQLDYVIHTERISMPETPTYQYPVDNDGIPLVGLKANGAITDHAPLTFTAELKADDR